MFLSFKKRHQKYFLKLKIHLLFILNNSPSPMRTDRGSHVYLSAVCTEHLRQRWPPDGRGSQRPCRQTGRVAGGGSSPGPSVTRASCLDGEPQSTLWNALDSGRGAGADQRPEVEEGSWEPSRFLCWLWNLGEAQMRSWRKTPSSIYEL